MRARWHRSILHYVKSTQIVQSGLFIGRASVAALTHMRLRTREQLGKALQNEVTHLGQQVTASFGTESTTFALL